jgi:enoyl-CoA hydratase/carnithine racemase
MTSASAKPELVEADAPVRRSLGDGVLTLTLSRPRSRNALSSEMMSALQAELDRAKAEEAVRVIVIAAEPPAFCAGHDLRELRAARAEPDGGRATITALMQQCSRLMQTVVTHPRPVIADVRGPASAAG